MKKLNTNARQRAAMFKIAASGRTQEAWARGRKGIARDLAAFEMKLATHFVRDLLAGRVHAKHRDEFVAAARECIASARQYREEGFVS